MNHARARVRQAEALQQRELQRFRDLIPECLAAIHYSGALLFQMGQVVQGVKDAVRAATVPGRGTHAIEDQGKFLMSIGRGIVVMMGSIYFHIRSLAPVQFRKHAFKPDGMLVVNGDRFLFRHSILPAN